MTTPQHEFRCFYTTFTLSFKRHNNPLFGRKTKLQLDNTSDSYTQINKCIKTLFAARLKGFKCIYVLQK